LLIIKQELQKWVPKEFQCKVGALALRLFHEKSTAKDVRPLLMGLEKLLSFRTVCSCETADPAIPHRYPHKKIRFLSRWAAAAEKE
jgi:hypothetical protein